MAPDGLNGRRLRDLLCVITKLASLFELSLLTQEID